jgi:thiamine pyrophosphokinase
MSPFPLAQAIISGFFPVDVERERCALVVSGSPARRAPSALVSRLATAAGFVVAVDSGAELLRAAGITPDLLLGDFDSIGSDTLAAFRAVGVELSAYSAHKDASDLELALDELRRRDFAAVLATNVLGGRLDHELASLGGLAAAAERGSVVALVEEGEGCVFLSATGARDRLRLAPDGARAARHVSLIPWGGEASVSIRGVEWELDHALLSPSSSWGVSNVPCEGSVVEVEVHSGTLIVVLET